MTSIIRGVEKLVSKFVLGKEDLNLFLTRRQDWLQNVTPDQLLDNLTQYMTTEMPMIHHRPSITQEDLKRLQAKFEQYAQTADDGTYFTHESFHALLELQFPRTKCGSVLYGSSPILFRVFNFYAFYPLNAPQNAKRTDIDYNAFIRASTFLSVLDDKVFSGQFDGCGIGFRERTAEVLDEAFFRSLAPSTNVENSSEASARVDEDVVDVIAEVIPKYEISMATRPREEFTSTARRLISTKPPLKDIVVLVSDVITLLQFLLVVLDEPLDSNSSSQIVKEKLKTTWEALFHVSENQINYDTLMGADDGALKNIRSAMAMAMGTLLMTDTAA